jgi:hypothetical protein
MSAGVVERASDKQLGDLPRVYEVFVQEGADEREIIDIYAKATVNLVSVAAQRGWDDAPILFNNLRSLLEELCVLHDGAYELPVRIYEVVVVQVRETIKAGQTSQIQDIEKRFRQALSKITPGEDYAPLATCAVMAGLVYGYLGSKDLERAMEAFDSHSGSLGVPDGIPGLALRGVIESLVNLASTAFDQGMDEAGQKYAEILMRVGRSDHATNELVRRGVSLMLRNRVVVAQRNGASEQRTLALSDWAIEIAKYPIPQQSHLAVHTCLSLEAGATIDGAAAAAMADIAIAVLEHARQANDASPWQDGVYLCQGMVGELRGNFSHDAARVLESLRTLVQERVPDPSQSLAEIDSVLTELRAT